MSAETNTFDFLLGEIPTDATVYPPGQVTALGEMLALEHIDPFLSVTDLARKRTFHISGPLAPWPGAQDGVQLLEISSPEPQFKHLKAKGSRQHGKTWNATVFDENEINIVCKAFGTTPERLGEVVSDWKALWNPRKLVRFEWLTFDKGLWWCDTRLGGAPNDRIQYSPRRHRQQVISQKIENNETFWRSVDSVSRFEFVYDDFTDTFTTNYDPGMGPNWPLWYEGPGGGHVYTQGGDLKWRDDPDELFFTDYRQVIFGPYKDFQTGTDNQVVHTVLNGSPEWSVPEPGKFYLGARMNRNPDGTWKGDGVFAEIDTDHIRIVRYNNFVRTVMWSQWFWPPPLYSEKYTLIAGTDGSPRTFKVLRNGSELLSRTETGTGSVIGPEHRGLGGGVYAGSAWITQASPPPLRKIAGGDNATVTQSGWLTLTNVGSEDGWPQIVFRGPGTIGVGNGPGSTDLITFGPLNEGQQVLISTHPRYRNVIDLTTSGTLTGAQRIEVEGMAKLVALGQVPALLSWWESVFGVLPPQGDLYKQLTGRFTRPVPGVDQPSEAVTSRIAVTVTNGNAQTQVWAALTPQRAWPE